MAEPEKTDLSWVTHDELVVELAKRNQGVLLVTIASLTADAECRTVWFRGGFAIALGMAELAKQYLIQRLATTEFGSDTEVGG